MKKYCYHVTDGLYRTALSCGVITASSMENAGARVANRLGLVAHIETDANGDETKRWETEDGHRRSIYIMLNP